MASEWQIIKDLYKGFGNNPRNVETFDAMANMNPLIAAYRGAKTLSNVDINPIRQSLLNEAYGINNQQDNRLALNQLVNIGSGVLDVAPTLPIAKAGAKGLLKVTENLPVGMSIKDVGRKLTPFEEALNLAQQRAALPVSEGGLGLPATNTAMDRAKAMGFDTPAYHATNNDIKYFIPSDVGTYGPGVYSAKRPEIAEGYYQDFNNSNTIPLLINRGKEKQFQSFSDYVGQKGKSRNTFDYGNDLRNEGYNSLSVKFFPEGEVREYNNFNPSDIRSINAAFDPFRRNEADILAGVAAAPVGLLAVDKDKKKKKNK